MLSRLVLSKPPVEVGGEGAFDAAACLPSGLAGGEEALVVGGRLGVVVDALERDHVSAQLRRRSPPRLRRWRCCLPLEASTGVVSARAAKDASLAIRPGSPLDMSSWAAHTAPTPHSSRRWGAISVTRMDRSRSSLDSAADR
jgi:hypothetical protein